MQLLFAVMLILAVLVLIVLLAACILVGRACGIRRVDLD
jgi:hypothetical protein